MKNYSIGTLPNNTIVLASPVVSRSHADILVADDGTITLTDHSKNGTMVNGMLLNNSSRVIKRGDNVMFANTIPLNWSLIEESRTGTIGNNAPNATATLVLGILSIVTPYFGLVLGIIGWCLGSSGMKKVKSNPAAFEGYGKLKAGWICSIISVSIYSFATLIGIFIALANL